MAPRPIPLKARLLLAISAWMVRGSTAALVWGVLVSAMLGQIGVTVRRLALRELRKPPKL